MSIYLCILSQTHPKEVSKLYKVLIIDDESIIRKGLINIINWSQLSCEICGEAADGIAGMELIKNVMPDIILTDIRMPKADGLIMIRQAKEVVPDCKIIILTGYRDFNYAQDAIKLGAFDFILKPTKIEELTEVIIRSIKEIEKRRVMCAEIDKYKEQYEKNIPVLRERLLYNLIHGLYPNAINIDEEMHKLNLSIDRYVMGIIDNESGEDKDSYSLQLYQFALISSLEEITDEYFSFLTLPINNRCLLFLARPLGDEEVDLNKLQEKLNYLQEMIDNCCNFTVSIAISSPGHGYKDLPQKFRECKNALEHRFYLGGNSLISYSDMNTFYKAGDYTILEQKQSQLMEQIKAGNQKSALEIAESIRLYIHDLKADDKAYIKSFYLNVLSSINTIRSSLSGKQEDKRNLGLTGLYPMIEACENITDLHDILNEAVRNAAERVNNYNKNNLKLLLKSAIEYLETHYHEPITLGDVAQTLYVSSFYLSRMFKRELNINFVDYLNEMRIKKAKELLKDVKYKTYEVAEAVGISDPHYFSRLFKKYEGITPTEYKDGQKSG